MGSCSKGVEFARPDNLQGTEAQRREATSVIPCAVMNLLIEDRFTTCGRLSKMEATENVT